MGSAKQLIGRPRGGAAHRRDEQVVLPASAAWTILLVSMLCRAALYTGIALTLWTLLPMAFGFTTTTVMSGSMSPGLRVGDAVVVKHIPVADLHLGQVLLVDDPDHPGELRLHRLHAIESAGVVLQGDANREPDTSMVAFSAIKGAGFLRIPFAGLPYFWLRTHAFAALGGLLLAVLLLASGMGLGRMLQDPALRVRRRHRGARLPKLHRAAAAGIGLVVVGTLAVHPVSSYASYAATTSNPGNSFASTCWDVPLRGTLPSSAVTYYNYMEGSGSTTVDRSGAGNTGALFGTASMHTGTCSANASPYVSLGATGVIVANALGASTAPTTSTIATWFRTSTAGGVIADFGSSGTAAASSTADRALYMTSAGAVTFGSSTLSIGNISLAKVLCTSAGGFANGAWHLVVATVDPVNGCSISVDGGTAVTQTMPLNAVVLSSYSGYLRLGYDSITSLGGWTGAGVSAQYFQGDLDETSAYSTALTSTQIAAIVSRGH